jgi:hypothetical protein
MLLNNIQNKIIFHSNENGKAESRGWIFRRKKHKIRREKSE